MNEQQLKNIVEGALLAAGRSLSLDNLQDLFLEDGRPDKGQLRKALEALEADYAERSIEIRETASGYRIQVSQDYSEWVSRLWEERPTRYSRALLETLALVAYRQPITRGEIEEVRGVSVSTSIMRTLQERDWVRVVGHRDVPGRPAMYGTTKTFLDYFGLKSLDELPTLSELRDIDSINVELDLRDKGGDAGDDKGAAPGDPDVPAESEADTGSEHEPHTATVGIAGDENDEEAEPASGDDGAGVAEVTEVPADEATEADNAIEPATAETDDEPAVDGDGAAMAGDAGEIEADAAQDEEASEADDVPQEEDESEEGGEHGVR